MVPSDYFDESGQPARAGWEQNSPIQLQPEHGKSSRLPNIRRHSGLWLLDYFRVHGRIVWLGADVDCWIGAGSGRAVQPFQRNSQHPIDGRPRVPADRSQHTALPQQPKKRPQLGGN
jgi:hypothetical protein